METIQFKVQGSAAEPYEVVFKRRSPGNLSAYCSCLAGQKGSFCKHRVCILKGETRGIVSDNPADVEVVRGWLHGTDLEAAIKDVEDCEDGVTLAESRLAQAKKKLSRALLD